MLTAYGRNILYRNNGNGTFADATERAGLAAEGWFTCATWFDYVLRLRDDERIRERVSRRAQTLRC